MGVLDTLTPPTDTLPKFCAVLGLAIFGGAIWMAWKVKADALQTMIETEVQFSKWEFLQKEVNSESENFTLLLDEIEKDKRPSREAVQLLRGRLDELKKGRASAHVEAVASHRQLGQLRAMQEQVQDVLVMFIFGSVIGFLLSIVGFYGWWKSENQQPSPSRAGKRGK